jgi:hypothetical protein
MRGIALGWRGHLKGEDDSEVADGYGAGRRLDNRRLCIACRC